MYTYFTLAEGNLRSVIPFISSCCVTNVYYSYIVCGLTSTSIRAFEYEMKECSIFGIAML